MAAITINEQREEIVDFSYPTFNSGLRILVSKDRRNFNLMGTIKEFMSAGYKQLIKPFVVLLALIFVFGNILWFAERYGTNISNLYVPGVFQAIWISLSVIIGSDGGFFVYEVSTWIGRLIMVLCQITSLAVLGLLIGELTAFITTRKIKLNIEGPQDLQGKKVATVKGSTSVAILKDLGANVVQTVTIEESYTQLKKGEIDAVVFDSPVLIYFSLNDGSGWAEIVGSVFEKQDYGIVLQNDSELRKDINIAILALKENGGYDEIYKKWFGGIE